MLNLLCFIRDKVTPLEEQNSNPNPLLSRLMNMRRSGTATDQNHSDPNQQTDTSKLISSTSSLSSGLEVLKDKPETTSEIKPWEMNNTSEVRLRATKNLTPFSTTINIDQGTTKINPIYSEDPENPSPPLGSQDKGSGPILDTIHETHSRNEDVRGTNSTSTRSTLSMDNFSFQSDDPTVKTNDKDDLTRL